MSVYTTVHKHELEEMIKNYTIGALVNFTGVEDGIENTTYFLKTEKEQAPFEWVLTLFEHISKDELEKYTRLLAYVSERGISVANPVCDAKGNPIQILSNKPAILSPKLAGGHITTPKFDHCRQIGTVMAKLHIETTDYPHSIPIADGFQWVEKETNLWIDQLESDERQLMQSALTLCREQLPKYDTLPRSVIHGDLFVDNALFHNDQLTGVIDFFAAGTDFMLMDIAVAINDWCVDNRGIIDPARQAALIESYQNIRKITPLEQKAMPFFLYLAALRYWTLRLQVQINNRAKGLSGDLIKFKDPVWFQDMLVLRQADL